MSDAESGLKPVPRSLPDILALLIAWLMEDLYAGKRLSPAKQADLVVALKTLAHQEGATPEAHAFLSALVGHLFDAADKAEAAAKTDPD